MHQSILAITESPSKIARLISRQHFSALITALIKLPGSEFEGGAHRDAPSSVGKPSRSHSFFWAAMICPAWPSFVRSRWFSRSKAWMRRASALATSTFGPRFLGDRAALLSLEQALCLLLDRTLPLTNLRRVNPMLLADLIDCLLPLERLKADLRLEGRGVGFTSLLLAHAFVPQTSDLGT